MVYFYVSGFCFSFYHFPEVIILYHFQAPFARWDLKEIQEPILSDEEWKAVMTESRQQAVTRIAFKAAKNYSIPEDIYNKWNMYSEMSYANAIVNQKGHTDVHDWMTAAGIDYVILKGCSSSYYYPVPLDRGMGDVDFLVKKDDLEKAGEILRKRGFVPAEGGARFSHSVS